MINSARNFYSDNAKIYSLSISDQDKAFYLSTQERKEVCIKSILENSNYNIQEFIHLLVLPNRNKIEEILNQNKIFEKITTPDMFNLEITKKRSEVISRCMSFNITSIRYVAKSSEIQKSTTIEVSSFVKKVENRYKEEIEKRVPLKSEWAKIPRFITFNKSCEIETHRKKYSGNNNSCKHIKFVRTSTINLDPSIGEESDFQHKEFGAARFNADPNLEILKFAAYKRAKKENCIEDQKKYILDFKQSILGINHLNTMAEEGSIDFVEEPDEFDF